jgi:2-phosphosulfolactate phosphatase
MRIDVALTPSLLSGVESSICVVVDVLRASTTCVSMFDRGIESIAVAPTPEAAREVHQSRLPGAFLCGEVGGLPPVGFDFGNSPLEFSQLDLSGRQAIMATSNGTRALHAVAAAPAVFVGCLRNRAAVADCALGIAGRLPCDVVVVCAGNSYGATFSLDDAIAAGAIVQRLLASGSGATKLAALSDAALAALMLHEARPNAASVFAETAHGQTLLALGFGADLNYAAELDRSAAVPALVQERDGLLTLRQQALP